MTWLRKRFQETPAEGPEAKRVKFQTVHQSLATGFPTVDFNSKMVSDVLKAAFPHTTRKPVGKAQLLHVYGIEETQDEVAREIPQQLPSLQADLMKERGTNTKLLERVQQLESQLREQQQMPGRLELQMEAILNPNNTVYHGPDTVEHLEQFSMDDIISEFKQNAPQLHELFQSLGNSSNDTCENETKIITSLCALVKSRSKKVLGLQLMISFMLIARATNKQVLLCTRMYTYTMHRPDETPLHPATKSEVVPMKVFRDEKYVSETIEILMDLAKNATLTGQPQVCLCVLYVVTMIDNCINMFSCCR